MLGRPQQNGVFRGALDLRSVLDDDQAVIGRRDHDLGDDRIRQGGFPGAGAANNEDVSPLPNRALDNGALRRGHNPLPFVILKGEDRRSPAPDRKDGRGDHRRYQGLEARPVERKLAFQHGIFPSDRGAERARDGSNEAFGGGGHHEADCGHRLAQALDPDHAVRIEHQLDHAGIGKVGAEGA